MRMLALGLIAAAGIALAGPASAQGIYLGPNGVGVGVEHGWYDHDRYRARADDRVVIRERHRECRTIIIHDDGMTRRIRRCR